MTHRNEQPTVACYWYGTTDGCHQCAIIKSRAEAAYDDGIELFVMCTHPRFHYCKTLNMDGFRRMLTFSERISVAQYGLLAWFQGHMYSFVWNSPIRDANARAMAA
jgi:hypothetical protein